MYGVRRHVCGFLVCVCGSLREKRVSLRMMEKVWVGCGKAWGLVLFCFVNSLDISWKIATQLVVEVAQIRRKEERSLESHGK